MQKSKTFRINGLNIKIAIDTDGNVASFKFMDYAGDILSKDLDDFIVLHYEKISKKLVGFSVLNLKEFLAKYKKEMTNKMQANIHMREYLKKKAEEAVYSTINNIKNRFAPWSIYSIPEPLWHFSE